MRFIGKIVFPLRNMDGQHGQNQPQCTQQFSSANETNKSCRTLLCPIHRLYGFGGVESLHYASHEMHDKQ